MSKTFRDIRAPRRRLEVRTIDATRRLKVEKCTYTASWPQGLAHRQAHGCEGLDHPDRPLAYRRVKALLDRGR